MKKVLFALPILMVLSACDSNGVTDDATNGVQIERTSGPVSIDGKQSFYEVSTNADGAKKILEDAFEFTYDADDPLHEKYRNVIDDAGGHLAYKRMMLTADSGTINDVYARNGFSYEGTVPSERQKNYPSVQEGYDEGIDGLDLAPRSVNTCYYLFPPYLRGNHFSPSISHLALNIDNVGRPKSGTQAFYTGLPRGKAPNQNCQQLIRGWGGQFSTDDGGHLIGRRFNGHNRRSNIVPQNAIMNQQPWNSRIEAGLALCVNSSTHIGEMKVDAMYSTNSGADVRPYGLLLTFFVVEIPNLRELVGQFYMANENPTQHTRNLAEDFYFDMQTFCA